MPLDTKTATIGGLTYTVAQLNAIDGSKVFLRLGRMIAPALGAVVKGGTMNIGTAVADALKNISDEDFEFLTTTFAKATSVDLGQQSPQLSSIFALHFAGKYLEMFEWLKFSVEVNYGPFLSALREMAALASAKEAKQRGAVAAAPSS